uniref:Uncharacterized protein n=1 Tax=Oryza sativa subsp. japonica TaxID=39947 RepID=Q8H435_ORYSJ|nr:hypothetical protein [Oryza sativa Japonica Group]
MPTPGCQPVGCSVSRTSIFQVVEEQLRLVFGQQRSDPRYPHSRVVEERLCLVVDQQRSDPSTHILNGQSMAVYLVLDQRSQRFSHCFCKVMENNYTLVDHIVLYAILTKPPRNLRGFRLGTPRADKALSDAIEPNDHVISSHESQTSGFCRRLYNYLITREWLEFDKDYRIKQRQEGSGATSYLNEFVFEEEDYLVIDYVLVIHAAKSTTAR